MSDTPTRDERIDAMAGIVHDYGIVPSKSCLSSHHYMRSEHAHGTIADERQVLHVAHLMDRLGDDILVLPRMQLVGSPTVYVSRIRFPHGDRALAYRYLAPLRSLGTTTERKRLLEEPMHAALRQLLPHGFSVHTFPTRFHRKTRDIGIVAPDGTMLDIELRNRATHIHDVITPPDRLSLQASSTSGRTTLFVGPQSTTRFRTDIATYNAHAIDTSLYVAPNPELAQQMTQRGWSCWPSDTPDIAIPLIAHQVATWLTTRYGTAPPPQPRAMPATAPDEPDTDEEITRLLNTHRRPHVKNASLVTQARLLYEQGISTQREAAAILGCTSPAISNAFKRIGEETPWSHGGRRPGSGRPQKSSSPTPPPPTA